jgi:hypothetical protein
MFKLHTNQEKNNNILHVLINKVTTTIIEFQVNFAIVGGFKKIKDANLKLPTTQQK